MTLPPYFFEVRYPVPYGEIGKATCAATARVVQVTTGLVSFGPLVFRCGNRSFRVPSDTASFPMIMPILQIATMWWSDVAFNKRLYFMEL